MGMVPRAGRVALAIVVAALAAACTSETENGLANRTSTTASEQTRGTEGPATETPTTTTTEPESQAIESGVYVVPDEVAPGTYRAAGYWARLDANQEIIDNDLAENGWLVLDVAEGDAFVEIDGMARPLAEAPSVDPFAEGFTEGTYLVGPDITPGQYRVTPAGTDAYWARLDQAHEIIDNNLSEGQLIVNVAEGDYLLTYTGNLERIK